MVCCLVSHGIVLGLLTSANEQTLLTGIDHGASANTDRVAKHLQAQVTR